MLNLLAIPNIVSLGLFEIALLDIVALVAIIIALTVGIIKGFAKQVLSILGFVAAIILAFLLCGKVAVFINNNIPLITNAIQGWVEKTVGFTSESFSSEEALRDVLANSKIPAFLHEAIVGMVVDASFEISIIETITGWVINVISFASLILLFLILFAVIKFIVKKVVSLPIIRTADKILGALFSLLQCLVIMLSVLSIASLIFPLNDFLKPDGVTCYLNSALELITNSSYFKNILNKILIIR